eukprot:1140134-Rhodomonas_salina.4
MENMDAIQGTTYKTQKVPRPYLDLAYSMLLRPYLDPIQTLLLPILTCAMLLRPGARSEAHRGYGGHPSWYYCPLPAGA